MYNVLGKIATLILNKFNNDIFEGHNVNKFG